MVPLLLLSAIACALPGFGDAPPAVTPTPMGDTLAFTIPAYTINLRPGDVVPGTRLQYVGRNADSYQVQIDGLTATKRAGDSFIWNGVLAPGVHASYNLRLITALFGPLPVAGTVRITVFNPEPVERDQLPVEGAGLSFQKIVVSYLVPGGRRIPGTTLLYRGLATVGEGDQASQLAELSGVVGYPYLALGDSLVWSGEIRDNVSIRYSLRVASLNEEGIRLAGTADLWIIPAN
jgi:hypothetical protein